MELEGLRNSISAEQKNGLPFIMASIVIWTLITAVCLLKLPVLTQNMLVFCCAAPLLPYSWLYKSKAYMVFAVFIPFAALLCGLMFSAPAVSAAMAVTDIVFVLLLRHEVNKKSDTEG